MGVSSKKMSWELVRDFVFHWSYRHLAFFARTMSVFTRLVMLKMQLL